MSNLIGSQGISGSGLPGFGRVGVMTAPKCEDDYSCLQTETLKALSKNTYQHRDPSSFAGNLQLLRLTPSAYGDSLNTPSGADRPNPRTISNEVFAQTDPIPNSKNCTDLFWIWGQFIAHDVGFTTGSGEALNIPVPTGDVYFDPLSTGNVVIAFERSIYDPTTGNTTPREQTTDITYEIDASTVYGSDTTRSTWLRLGRDGLLKTSQGNLLPFNKGTDPLPNAGTTGKNIFLAGDLRANENIGLTSIHTLFVREHNWWARELQKVNPNLTDEQLYQKARIMVESEIQAITYNEYLPLLIGQNSIPKYTGYKPAVNTTIATEFSTAAYRLGHSLVTETLWRLNNDGTVIPEGNLSLRDAFFSPDHFGNDCDLSNILKGASSHVCEKLDSKIVDSLRNFLFGQPGAGGLDLASLNIQRGRDHGLPDYNTARVALGLAAKSTFAEITTNTVVQTALSTAYSSDINKIDIWVGGLCEDPVTDSQLGELFQTIVVDQFTRTRDGDELWYENRLTDKQIKYVNKTRLNTIIRRNSNARNLGIHVMQV